ncbi:MAG TPA: DUF5667 domain-containing protein [Candidatus Limnocylindria bacterium]|nr:DUF5667 domain-containing protein [Candidatus Limnocylindria bacterium]
MSAYTNDELRQLDHVEDMLEAYADARLSPSGPVLARIRANAMAMVAASAAIAAAIAAAESRAGEPAALASRWRLPQLQVPRRAFALGLAATMTLGTSAAVLAAPPGSPFYNARMAIEGALLPTQVDARLAAYEEHLAQRVAEAQAAAASGDHVGLEAALAAYAREVDAAVSDIGDDADRLAHLEAVLAKHVAVLTALEAKVPGEASIDRAIESSQKAVEKIKEKARKGGGGRPTDLPSGSENLPGRD